LKDGNFWFINEMIIKYARSNFPSSDAQATSTPVSNAIVRLTLNYQFDRVDLTFLSLLAVIEYQSNEQELLLE
jgi:hypothetical protein